MAQRTPTPAPAPMPTPSSALYDALAPVYDRWQSTGGMTPFALVTLAKLLPALERHGRHRNQEGASPADRAPPRRSFVDLGCGTGQLVLGLAHAHPDWRLTGVDGSPGMIDCARDKPGGDRITWRVSPFDAPPLPPPSFDSDGGQAGLNVGFEDGFNLGFDAAGCFYDTVNHLTDAAALAAMAGSVAAALRPGGLFVFDATNDLGFDLWWRGNRTWRGRDWSVAVETRYDPVLRQGHAEVAIDHHGRRTEAQLTERCFSEPELRTAMSDAGLEVVVQEPWSPFDIDAPGKTWWITRKRPP